MSWSLRLRLLPALFLSVVLTACSASVAPSAPTPAPSSTSSPSPSTSPSETTSPSATTSPAGYPDPLPLTGDIDGVHDPSMVRAPDGSYLLYSTGANLQIRTSKDRLSFTEAGPVWPKGAPWTFPYTALTDKTALWAPDVSFHDGTFYLYYAASSFGSQHSAIFLATSTTGLSGSWTNRGKVLESDDSMDYNAIDPNLVVDKTGWWLSFGSFWSGLKLVRLDERTGLRDRKDTKVYALATRPRSVEGAVEAPYIVSHGGYHYLFAAFDLCCRGISSTYRTMVGRSTSVTGPYVDKTGKKMTAGGGTEVLATHGDIVGPGHPAVLHDGSDWLLIYHYYADALAPATGRLAMNKLEWVAGWPVVR